MKKILMFAVVAVGAVALTASALAGPGGTNRPFNGAGSGTTTATGGPAVFTSTTTGTMIATHLGKGTYTIDATQNWTGATWPANPCAVVVGTFVFTAANGAMVEGDVDGTTCEVAPFVNTSYASDLDFDITGGTGRFTLATGALDITGTSTATGPGVYSDTLSATGTISY